jgi:hypothetical protein
MDGNENIMNLFEKILKECITTNVLQPEYEVFLIQYICENNDIHIQLQEWLLKLMNENPDFCQNGWIYLILYSISDDEEYLSKSAECNNEYAVAYFVCEKCINIKDNTELIKLYNSGNLNAAIMLYEYDNNIGLVYLQEAALKNVNCAIILVNEYERSKIYPYSKNIENALTFLTTLGYHRYGSDYISNIKSETLLNCGKKLTNMGIPCGYWVQSCVNYNESNCEYFNNMHEGKMGGCNWCNIDYRDIDKRLPIWDYVYNLYKQLKESKEKVKRLETLQSCSLEDVVKNIICEYL